MRILVTGATGFIGKHVIAELLKTEIEIIATSNENIEDVKKIFWFNKVKYISCNLNESKENFYTFFDEPDNVIHLAWEGLPNYNELFHIERNLFANYFFIKNLIENGLKRISIIGTCFEYGIQNGCLQEEMQTNPSNSYGLAKDTLRKFIQELNKKFDFTYNWIRLFYLYGDGQNSKSLLSQLENALKNKEEIFNMSGGEQLRDYMAVGKVAEYIKLIAINNNVSGIINCCSGIPISVRCLVEAFLKNNNSEIKLNLGYYPYSDYEPFAFWGDNSKLLKILQ